MNDPVLALSSRSQLGQLLDEHFGEPMLRRLLGPEVACLDPSTFGKAVYQPLSEFLERPGKEFRAVLVATSYALAGGRGECPRVLQSIVEILHAGSLIVDDIQDESHVRRGRPALHVEHGLPVALNAGHWMYFWAFSLVEQLDVDESTQLALYRWMSRTLVACHHGQGLDLTARMQDLTQDRVPEVVAASTKLKTGALMELAAVLGAVAAGADAETVARLGRFGCRLGTALQMLDDVGGLVSEKRALKGHEDLTHGRPTWPWAWLAQELGEGDYAVLRKLASDVQSRDVHPEVLCKAMRRALSGSGRVRVRRYLHDAFAELRDCVGSSRALGAIEREITRLEKSYG
jgi:geranylgeranyl pyrophosphate synthase